MVVLALLTRRASQDRKPRPQAKCYRPPPAAEGLLPSPRPMASAAATAHRKGPPRQESPRAMVWLYLTLLTLQYGAQPLISKRFIRCEIDHPPDLLRFPLSSCISILLLSNSVLRAQIPSVLVTKSSLFYLGSKPLMRGLGLGL